MLPLNSHTYAYSLILTGSADIWVRAERLLQITGKQLQIGVGDFHFVAMTIYLNLYITFAVAILIGLIEHYFTTYNESAHTKQIRASVVRNDGMTNVPLSVMGV